MEKGPQLRGDEFDAGGMALHLMPSMALRSLGDLHWVNTRVSDTSKTTIARGAYAHKEASGKDTGCKRGPGTEGVGGGSSIGEAGLRRGWEEGWGSLHGKYCFGGEIIQGWGSTEPCIPIATKGPHKKASMATKTKRASRVRIQPITHAAVLHAG